MTDAPKPELTDEELAEFRAFLAERRARAAGAGAGDPGATPDPVLTGGPLATGSPGVTDGPVLTRGPAAGGGPATTPRLAERPRPAPVSGDDVAYIRGGAGMAVDTGRAVRIFVGFCLLALATLVILLFVSAVHQNSRFSQLERHGVPVNVTVTNCLGLASGTGVTQYGFICRGNFSIDGHSYNEVIRGTSVIHTPGEVLQALTVPGHPTLLSTTDAVVHRVPSSTVYITPAILAGVLFLGMVVAVWFFRRARRRGEAELSPVSEEQAVS